jgi:hypothetical protein
MQRVVFREATSAIEGGSLVAAADQPSAVKAIQGFIYRAVVTVSYQSERDYNLKAEDRIAGNGVCCLLWRQRSEGEEKVTTRLTQVQCASEVFASKELIQRENQGSIILLPVAHSYRDNNLV